MNAKTFFTDRPIAYHPIVAKVFGSATVGLYLSQLGYWSDKGFDKDGWIYKTEAEMEDETGLSRKEQETARKKLIWGGVLEAERRGIPARMWYRINWDALTALMDAYEQAKLDNKLCETDNPVVRNVQTSCAKRANSTEITTETTTENNHPTPAAANGKTDNPFQTWEASGVLLSPIIAEQLGEWVDEYPDGWVSEAIKRAARANKRNLNYVGGILKRWVANGMIDGLPQEIPKGATNSVAPAESPPIKWVDT